MYQIPSIDKSLPARGKNVYPSGLSPAESSVAVYGPAASIQPTLSIVTPIYDDYGNVIMPGFYELSLSFDKKMMYITQSQKLIATLPVIKYEDTRSHDEVKQTMDSRTLKKQEKQKKKAEKKKKKDIEDGKYMTDQQPYNKATIEFDDANGYYLIKYERDKIEAWGAIKPGM